MVVSRLISPLEISVPITLDKKQILISPDLLWALPEYNRVRDCLLGELQVKSKRTEYLPRPTQEKTKEADHRYAVYLERAVFWNFTQRHHSSLVGQMFINEPEINLPTKLQGLEQNADGLGTPLVQLAKLALSDMLAYGRCGFFTDFPPTGGMVTLADSNFFQPVISLYSPFKILSWQRDDKNKIISVLIEDSFDDLGLFVTKKYLQYRHLVLGDGGVFRAAIYRPVESIELPPLARMTCVTAGLALQPELSLHAEYSSVDAAGLALDVLPFEFSGAENNREDVDKPPLYPLASANLSDYRTSAD